MKGVELYARVRYAVRIEGISGREAARRFGIDPRTVAKMLLFSLPLGYRRSRPAGRPKLDPFVGIIDRILEEDKGRPAKQRHTSKRIFERLRDEHGYVGGLTIIKDYVLTQRQRQREVVFDPLHYLALLERKTGALDQAAPLAGWELPEEFATLRRLLEARMGGAAEGFNDAQHR